MTPEKQVYLRPGELFIGSKAAMVTTVLGSCVAVTLFHPKRRLAAMCHAIWADPGPYSTSCQDLEQDGLHRYVSAVIPAMTSVFFRQAIAPEEIEVKLFGGASFWSCDSSKTVGHNNIQRARQLLEEAHLQICRSDVGGEMGRKLIFDTTTGVVLLKTTRARRNARLVTVP